jgi:hypothetical protein
MTPASAKKNSDQGGRNKAAAPGQYLGYSLQPVRLCFHLLNEDEASNVFIEHLDDVSVHTKHGILLEQTKSALSQNPVSDWSEDLWKTFANWVDGIENGRVEVTSTDFRLYVTPVHGGHLVQVLSDATTAQAADEAVGLIQNELSSLPRKPTAYKYIKRLLGLDAARRRQLIINFRLESEHTDPVDAIRRFFQAAVSANMVERCCVYAIGRAKEGVDAQLRAGKPAMLNAGEFRKAIIAFVQKNDLNLLLVSLASAPSAQEVSQTHALSPKFVRQLAIIDLPDEQQLRAVSDYLQASANKTKWADEGFIVRESLGELDERLLHEHAMHRVEIAETLSTLDPKSRGRVLYARCGGSKAKLQGREVPTHFIPGCYHDLADRMRLGWHPKYEELLAD